MIKRHERKFWNYVADTRGKRSYKPNRKRLKAWTAKTQVIDGFKVKVRNHSSNSKAMKHIKWWI